MKKHRARVLAALALVIVVSVAAAVLIRSAGGEPAREVRFAGLVRVTAVGNDGVEGPVRAQSRRLRLTVETGGYCYGQRPPEIVEATAAESATTVQLTVRVRLAARVDGPCEGLGTSALPEVTLEQPLGRRRIAAQQSRVEVPRR